MSHFDFDNLIPEGFSIAPAQDPTALDALGRLPGQGKSHYVDRDHHVSGRAEMLSLISELDKSHTL